MVIQYMIGTMPGGLMVHFQIPINADNANQGQYSVGPNDGSLLCPISERVAAALISHASEAQVFPNGTDRYEEVLQ